MRWFGLGSILLVILILAVPILGASDNRGFIQFEDNLVSLCPVGLADTIIPDINQPNCQRIADTKINTHHRQLWVIGEMANPRPYLKPNVPIGLYISAKASSRAYLNGTELGENGRPGDNKASEKIGQLDAVFFVPRELLRNEANQIAILMSGQHSIIPSTQAVLTLRFGPYRVAPHHGRGRFWVSLLTFGVFFIGAIYFGATTLLGYKAGLSATLGVASLFAAFQLLSEVTRSVWAYPYPFHDIRLILICSFSMGVGFVLALHTFDKFKTPFKLQALTAVIAVTLLGLFFIPSFDGKATWVMLVPIVTAGLVALSAWHTDRRASMRYALAFFIFAGIILTNPRQYLDTYYYIILMVLFIYLFIQQAVDIRSAIRDYEKAEEGRLRLEAALEKVSVPNPKYLIVKGAGRQERLDMYDISVLTRADEYVSIRLKGGREILHRASLGGLQKDLPACFLPVHRSHIINTNFVVKLKRLTSGVGELTLIDDNIVPVSRRIMPRVRKVLSQ